MGYVANEVLFYLLILSHLTLIQRFSLNIFYLYKYRYITYQHEHISTGIQKKAKDLYESVSINIEQNTCHGE